MPVCCRIQLCCDPPGAAAALAREHGIPQDAAGEILASYQLVPRMTPLAVGLNPSLSEIAAEGRERLEALHAHVKAELMEILPALGHPVRA